MIANGFTLLEVLVSLFILALLLLGLDAVQMKALHSVKSAYYFSVATEQLNSMLERLQTTHYQNNIDSLQLLWNEQNKRVLPQGRGTISLAPPNVVLTIYWGKIANCDRDKIGQSGCVRVTTKALS